MHLLGLHALRKCNKNNKKVKNNNNKRKSVNNFLHFIGFYYSAILSDTTSNITGSNSFKHYLFLFPALNCRPHIRSSCPFLSVASTTILSLLLVYVACLSLKNVFFPIFPWPDSEAVVIVVARIVVWMYACVFWTNEHSCYKYKFIFGSYCWFVSVCKTCNLCKFW